MTTGGTIGLFLGASIVSVVEAGFWVYKVHLKDRTRKFKITLFFTFIIREQSACLEGALESHVCATAE